MSALGCILVSMRCCTPSPLGYVVPASSAAAPAAPPWPDPPAPRTILPSSAATASSPSASIRTGKEHPVLVDLETLFHPEEAEPVSREEGEVPSWMTPNHVMATGLLPSAGESGPDVGGIGGGPGQKAAKPATVVDNTGADEMRIQRREIELLPADNRPEYVDGRKVDPGDHVRDVKAGFVRVYESDTRESGRTSSPVGTTDGVQERVLLRSTQQYAMLYVLAWSAGISLVDTFLSVVTVFKIELGILRVATRQRPGERIAGWFHELLRNFQNRVLDVNTAVALQAANLHVPGPRPERDAVIAATALVHGLAVATRNIADFRINGLATVNPWAWASALSAH